MFEDWGLWGCELFVMGLVVPDIVMYAVLLLCMFCFVYSVFIVPAGILWLP